MRKQAFFLVEGFRNFLLTVFRRRFLIVEMAKRDIMTGHIGSLLGFFWTFVNPVIMVFILWVVFSIGFKAAPKDNVPFVVWLTAGMSVWNAFSEIVNGSTSVIVLNAHLVKKIVFPLSILPVVKLLASFVTHSVFLLVLIFLIALYGMPFSLYWVQALYYFMAMGVLALGLAWMSSAVNVFARDMGQIINVVMQIGFWSTPIFWDPGIMPPKIQCIVKLNPMFYIVQGYRDSFIYFVPFWNHWQMTLYFWGITGLIFVVGAIVFLSLRPHFADVM